MPVTPSYPGVYIEEAPSGVRPVIGVATGVAAFVGYVRTGPEHRAVRVNSFGEFERRFGGVDRDSELSLAVQQFFRNGGSAALVVRVPRADARPASVTLLDKVGTGPKSALVLDAASTGGWGSGLLVDVDHDDAADARTFNLSVQDAATGATERFTGLSSDPASAAYAVTVLNDPDRGSSLVWARAGASGAGRPVSSGTLGAAIGSPTVDVAKNYRLTVQPDRPTKPDPADPTRTVPAVGAVTVTALEKGERLPSSPAGMAALLQRKINTALGAADGAAGMRVRVLPTADGGLRILGDVDPQVAPVAVDAAFTVTGASASGDVADGAALLGLGGATANVGRYTPVGAKRLGQGDVVTGSDGTTLPGTTALIGSEAAYTGIYALLKTDLFNLLCIPDATRAKPGAPTTVDTGLDPEAVWAAAYELCARRRAMLLVDPPPGVDDPDRALDWINQLGVKGPNAVAHFPRLRIPDPTDGFQPRTVAPGGTLAGLYARQDTERGVWKAPAGTEAQLRGVTNLVYPLTDAENGVLNPLGLNCLRTFPVVGTVNWGARTTAGADVLASQWKYTPVRRLALYIEESVFRGTQWAVFEPNDEPLWSQLRLNLTSFMQDLFRKGAFAGRTPREAYLVRCDAETTTADDRDRGVVNVVVGFAPLKPAEFVIVRIQQLAGQSPS
ncbi:phage tail sheath C-terminal domain-containing protein [Micromonospora sp. NPDC048170]|uniref:phage tail sheath family protein n=1 Tax=Micromonospora sp. NPDC048170 TaxID=3154819 RepID=UPI0033D2F2FA